MKKMKVKYRIQNVRTLLGLLLLVLTMLRFCVTTEIACKISNENHLDVTTEIACKISNENHLDSNSLVEEDYFFRYGFSANLNTPPIFVGGTIQVFYTVLSVTHGNVSFDGTQGDDHTWSPPPENFTLELGEQYSETFTLEHGIESRGVVSYTALLTEENTNATVRFGYNIINAGTNPAKLPYGTIFLSFIILSSFILIKKRISKE